MIRLPRLSEKTQFYIALGMVFLSIVILTIVSFLSLSGIAQ